MKIDFNVNILEDLLTRDERKAAAIRKRFPQFDKWRKRTDKPTIKQLSGLASFFNIPFGYFFLKKVPQNVYPIPHYRSSRKGKFEPSQELLTTIEILQERQDWARDLLKDVREPLPFAGEFSTETKIRVAVHSLRNILNLPENWANSADISTWDDAFKLLIKRAEDAGIFVVVNGVVNNDAHKKLDTDEFRGFALFDVYAPFIFINGKDFVSGKIFTIIHEIVHILIGKSASFDLKNLIPAENEIEEFCDNVTAEFLVPELQLSIQAEKYGADYEKLAKHFKVSRIVIARRLLDIGKITQQKFMDAYNSFKVSKGEKTDKKTKGGSFYNTAPYRISRSFFNLIYTNVKQERLLYRDAFKLTGLSPKSFDGYVKKVLTNSSE